MSIDGSSQRTRRAILSGAFGAMAAVGLNAVARPAPAAASTGDVVLNASNSSTNTTQIFDQTADNNAFMASAAGSGIGVQGTSQSGQGVYGFLGTKAADTTTGSGVYGHAYTTNGSTFGVQGVSDSDAGTGVHGHVPSTTGLTYGVTGASLSTSGRGVAGFAYAATGGTIGVSGASLSPSGIGVYGANFATSGASYGVQGVTGSPGGTGVLGRGGVGVRGESSSGRGGVFKGKAAQVRLIPSTAATHPSSGALGDLFLDKNKRLWFCKGGTTWHQLA